MGRVGLAESYIDPIAKIPAQDEAVYASTSLHMATQGVGGWLNPMFLGRYAFYKPPMLYWLTAVAAKVGGPSLWMLRAPAVLCGAVLVALVFVWAWRLHNLWAAVAASVLLASDPLFHLLSRLTLTDMPVVLCITIAMFCLHWDPGLSRTASVWTFGSAVGAAILTKSIAGLLPLMMLVAAGVGVRRFAQVCGVGALVAAPWHAYQLLAHTRWFWAEYVLTENFTWAVAAPEQSTQDNQFHYYWTRLWGGDPALVVAAALGIPVAIRQRSRLLAAWIGVVLFAFVAFGYRNTSYLLLLIPALVLLGAGALRWPVVAVPILLVSLWPRHVEQHTLPSVAELRNYADLHRANDLIIVAPDDEFVSSTLGLHHLRYAFFEPEAKTYRLPLDFRFLGITVTVSEYNDQTRWLPVWTERLREFGLASTEPIATVIAMRSVEEFQTLLAAHPEADFYVPANLLNPGATGRRFYYRR